MAQNSSTTLTPEDQAKIEAQIKASQDAAKQAQLEFEMKNRILDAQREQPGYRYS